MIRTLPLLFLLLLPLSSRAQHAPATPARPAIADEPGLGGRLGVGGQIGNPSGVSFKLYRETDDPLDIFLPIGAIELLAAWDLDEFFFFNAHLLHERPIEASPLRYFLGYGLLAGVDKEDFAIGASLTGGINFFVENFEVYIQVTPRLTVLPSTRGELGGGVGLRFYF